jgi:hypothetical protein
MSQVNSTGESGELEWCIRENTSLVPSYSEALLMGNDPPIRVPTATSSYSIRAINNNSIDRRGTPHRRSLGSILNLRRPSSEGVSRSSTNNRLVLYYPSPLVETCPVDPFNGRELTTPTEEEPPPYEEALRLPVLTRLRRSLTDRGDICRRSIFGPRRSCQADLIRPPSSRARTLITMETSL